MNKEVLENEKTRLLSEIRTARIIQAIYQDIDDNPLLKTAATRKTREIRTLESNLSEIEACLSEI